MRFCLSALLIAALASLAGAAELAPLSSKDAGLYVGTAGDYMFGDVPFAFSIEQVSRQSDPARLADVVERLAANGKRPILDIFLYEKGDEQARPAAEYLAWLEPLLAKLPLDKVYAITLSEENIYWNGHQELLAELYRQVKARHPALAVYQWYSPGAGAPGFGWPLLPADGWLIDEYCKPRDQFAKLVKQYTLLGKPLIHIAWAAPGWPEFSTWDQVFDDQLEICRRYGVPVSFFCWWPPNSTPAPPGNQSMWSWEAPPGTEHWRVFSQKVVPYVRSLRDGLRPREDPDLSTGQPIPVAGDEQGQYSYHEAFDPAPRFLDDADLTGFTALRWTGERLEVHGGQTSTLSYRFVSPFALHGVRATVKRGGNAGAVKLIMSGEGRKWAAGKAQGELLTAALPEVPGLKDVRLRLTLTDKDQAAGVLEDLQVTMRVDPPAKPQVTLSPAGDGTVTFSDDFRSQLYLHAGRVTNGAELKWVPGQVRMFGKQGYANEASLDYHFVCTQAVADLNVSVNCSADKGNFGALVAVALSADGRTFEPAATTDAGGAPKFNGDLTVKPQEPTARKDFWVRVTLKNTCGAATKVASPWVGGLTVTGRVAE